MVEQNLRLGIFGGTFDPVHLGHLQIAKIALKLASLDQVHFVTSVHPPHKSEKTHANFLDRHAMVALAVKGQKHFVPSSIEADRPGKSYSIDTIHHFRRYAGVQGKLFFIIGSDAFLEITSWKDYEQFPSLCNFLVFARPGFRTNELGHPFYQSFVVEAFDERSRLRQEGTARSRHVLGSLLFQSHFVNGNSAEGPAGTFHHPLCPKGSPRVY